MIYKINNIVIFSGDDGTIWLVGDEEKKILLTSTTSRLLSFFLDRHGEVLTRDQILIEVWDNHGLRSTNNSLNKYVSDIRNIIRNFGISDELIITIPRVGFSIAEGTTIERIEQKKQLLLIPSRSTLAKKNAITIIMLVLIMIALVMVFSYDKLVSQKKYTIQNQIFYPTGEIDGCTVYMFKKLPVGLDEKGVGLAKKIIQKNNIKCTTGSVVYLGISDSVIHGDKGRVFIAHCIKNTSPDSISTCNNIYEPGYEYQ